MTTTFIQSDPPPPQPMVPRYMIKFMTQKEINTEFKDAFIKALNDYDNNVKEAYDIYFKKCTEEAAKLNVFYDELLKLI